MVIISSIIYCVCAFASFLIMKSTGITFDSWQYPMILLCIFVSYWCGRFYEDDYQKKVK